MVQSLEGVLTDINLLSGLHHLGKDNPIGLSVLDITSAIPHTYTHNPAHQVKHFSKNGETYKHQAARVRI